MLGDHPIHLVLLAPDLDAARDFYANKIGLKILTESPEAVSFQCGGDSQLDVTQSTVGTADLPDPGGMEGQRPGRRGRRPTFPRSPDRGIRQPRPED